MRRLSKLYNKIDSMSSEIYTNLCILLGGSMWLVKDILERGIECSYIPIALMFILGFIGLIISLRKHARAVAKKKAEKKYLEENEDRGEDIQ